jgi:hypothetical protein
VDVAIDKTGRLTAATYGVTFTTIPTGDGRLSTSRGSADFAMRSLSDGVLEVERDAGVRETLHRIAEASELPRDLPGRYSNPDIAATWTIVQADSGMALHIVGPLRANGPWEIEPVQGDCIRIISPMTLYRAWLDVRLLRDAAGEITGLHVDSSRARNLLFTREQEPTP